MWRREQPMLFVTCNAQSRKTCQTSNGWHQLILHTMPATHNLSQSNGKRNEHDMFSCSNSLR